MMIRRILRNTPVFRPSLIRHSNRHKIYLNRFYSTQSAVKHGPVHGPRGIYFDFGATTPLDPRVLDAMLPYFTQEFGNPHSRTHEFGWSTEEAVENARKHVAALIGANPKEIIFTSGATESNNTALKGVARFYKATKNHVITTQTEHKCILDTCRNLEEEGFKVTYLPVQKNGIIDLKQLEEAITPQTAIVSTMLVNNEIGVIQPIREIGEICRKHDVFFHTDAAQALGKIDIDVNRDNIDLMSMSSHKIYGPKGIGALYIRRKQPRVRLQPLINGGGQERGIRSGTLAPALVVGFGEACRVAKEEMERDYEHIKKLSKRLYDGIMSIEHVELNGDLEQRYPGNLNISFSFVEGESLLMALKHVALSSGSACTSASLEPSYVLRALGVNEELAHTSLRFGIGRFTTEEEVDYVISELKSQVERLRELSPLWEMYKEGIDISKIEWGAH
jgi:cysteine desulfurase